MRSSSQLHPITYYYKDKQKMADLGVTHTIRDSVASQDAIGWIKFLHRNVSLKISRCKRAMESLPGASRQ